MEVIMKNRAMMVQEHLENIKNMDWVKRRLRFLKDLGEICSLLPEKLHQVMAIYKYQRKNVLLVSY